MRIKLLSYNIHKGFDLRNKNYFLKEIKDFIISTEADIVFLQEVVGKNIGYQKKGLVDAQFEFLADQIWPHYSYAKNALYDHGHHGNLILSKYPIESAENIDISNNFIEKRGFLFCKIKTAPNHKTPFFYAACTHFDLMAKSRAIQYKKVQLIIDKHLKKEAEYHAPLIIAGDFNDWTKKSTHIFENELQMKEVFKSCHGEFAKTFPAPLPMLCLDRIYIKKATVINASIFLPQNIQNPLLHLSDHLPLFCEIELNEK